jgi:hypothetical protein
VNLTPTQFVEIVGGLIAFALQFVAYGRLQQKVEEVRDLLRGDNGLVTKVARQGTEIAIVKSHLGIE